MWLTVLNLLKHAASFTIPVPLAAIVAVWGFYEASAWWDKTSAIKKAVDSAVYELVTGAEKEALQEKLKGQIALKEAADRIAAREKANAERDRIALENFKEHAENEIDDMQERIDELKDSGAPVISRPQYDKLRNK